MVTIRFHAPRRSASILLWTALSASLGAEAAGAGDTAIQVGWLHAQTLDKSDPLTTDLTPSPLLSALRISPQFTSEGTSAALNNADTVEFSLSHFFTNHIAIKADGGLPPVFHINGTGVVQPQSSLKLIDGLLPQVDLGASANNPLATAREWTPAILAQYYFLDPASRFRPNLGLGLTYCWFTDIALNANFVQSLNQNFGPVLALAAGKLREGPTHVGASASYQWSVIYNAGFEYALTRHWGLVGSLSYLPLQATAHITVFAADGEQLSDSRAHIHLNPLASALLLSYHF